MIKIQRYLKKHNMTQGQFGNLVGAKQCTVSMWVRGAKRIGPHMAITIEKKTGGEILRADIRPDLFAA